MKTDTNRHYLSVEETAKIFGVEEATIREWAKTGKLAAKKIGKQWFFSRSNIFEQQSVEDAIKLLGGGQIGFTNNYDLVINDSRIEIKSSNLKFGKKIGTYWSFTNFHPAEMSDFYLLLGYDPTRTKLLCAFKVPSIQLEKRLPLIVTKATITTNFNINTRDEFFYPYIIFIDKTLLPEVENDS